MENGGIIYYDQSGDGYVKKAPCVYALESTFSMHAVQQVVPLFGAGGGNSGFKIKMKTDLIVNSIRESNHVYNLRLQYYGDNADTWLRYYKDKYEFEDGALNTLFYKPSDPAENQNGIWFVFTHASVMVSIQ
jgi:hypothetical protein